MDNGQRLATADKIVAELDVDVVKSAYRAFQAACLYTSSENRDKSNQAMFEALRLAQAPSTDLPLESIQSLNKIFDTARTFLMEDRIDGDFEAHDLSGRNMQTLLLDMGSKFNFPDWEPGK